MIDQGDVHERSVRLAASLAERAEEAEAARRLPQATIDDLIELDLLAMVVPTSLGGHGLGVTALAPAPLAPTGSDTVILDEVFVPTHRTLPAPQLLLGGDGLDGRSSDRAASGPIRLGTVTSDLDRRMALRLSASATVRTARSIISSIAEGTGTSVYFSSHPFQRLQRDVAVLNGHVIFDWDRTTELAGRVALGLPLQPTDMV